MAAWDGDLLDRSETADFLVKYLTKNYAHSPEKPFILNLNSEWGFGKTYFLKNLAEELKEKYPIVYFDAWENDFSDQPLLSFLSEVNEQLQEHFSAFPKVKSHLKDAIGFSKKIIAPIVIKKLTGSSLGELLDQIETDQEKRDEQNLDQHTEELQEVVSSVMTRAAELAFQENKTIKQSIKDFKINESSEKPFSLTKGRI